jgi:Family of unknown function (DUF5336)
LITVVYSPGNRDYPSAYPAAYSDRRPDIQSPLSRNLFIVVAVLGLATYVFNFGPVGDGPAVVGWDVRFAALAALCAMFGLLAKRNPLPLAIAVLATMGFLDALANVLTGADHGWAMTVIVILNALQAAAAAAALLLTPRATTPPAESASYEAYVDYYNRAVRSYYGQQGQAASPEQSQRAGYGQAHADGRAGARAPRSQRPSQQGDYADLDYTGVRTPAPQHETAGNAGPTGLPSVGQARTRADQPLHETDQPTRPSSPA